MYSCLKVKSIGLFKRGILEIRKNTVCPSSSSGTLNKVTQINSNTLSGVFTLAYCVCRSNKTFSVMNCVIAVYNVVISRQFTFMVKVSLPFFLVSRHPMMCKCYDIPYTTYKVWKMWFSAQVQLYTSFIRKKSIWYRASFKQFRHETAFTLYCSV